MTSLLQGFEEVRLVKPVGKTMMTVTDSAIRFNKATAEVLGFPAHVKVLVNEKTKQIAVTPTTAKALNALKFSRVEGKQTTSISLKDAAFVETITQYFELPEAPEGEVAYQSVNGAAYPESKTVIFNIAGATSGTMKRRGRKKAA
jgi:ribosomal protein L11